MLSYLSFLNPGFKESLHKFNLHISAEWKLLQEELQAYANTHWNFFTT